MIGLSGILPLLIIPPELGLRLRENSETGASSNSLFKRIIPTCYFLCVIDVGFITNLVSMFMLTFLFASVYSGKTRL